MNRNEEKIIAQRIRQQYIEKGPDSMTALCALDARVKRPASILAYTLGCIGAVIMGAGMSLVMTDMGETLGMASPMVAGVLVGIVGMLVVAANYPIYKAYLAARRKKYAKDILALSDKIINE